MTAEFSARTPTIQKLFESLQEKKSLKESIFSGNED
jgi:hypothetical protein